MTFCGFCQLKENNVNQEFQRGNCLWSGGLAYFSETVAETDELPFHKSEQVTRVIPVDDHQHIWCVIGIFLTRQCTSDYVILLTELVLRSYNSVAVLKCSVLQVQADLRPNTLLKLLICFQETARVSLLPSVKYYSGVFLKEGWKQDINTLDGWGTGALPLTESDIF